MWWAELLNSIVALLESGAGGGGGSYESIATITPTSGFAASFTSIPSTYKHLQLRVFFMSSAAGMTGINLQFNADTSGNYASHRMVGEGTTVVAAGAASASNIPFIVNPTSSPGTTIPRVSIIDLHDYSVTTKNKTVRAFGGFDSNTSNCSIGLYSGLWMNTAAINQININTFQEFTSGAVISLYGIKGA
jgi:hypothetical protein